MQTSTDLDETCASCFHSIVPIRSGREVKHCYASSRRLDGEASHDLVIGWPAVSKPNMVTTETHVFVKVRPSLT